MKLAGWGRYPQIDTELLTPRDLHALIEVIQRGQSIARGNGRAYGDSAVSCGNTVHMKHFNRMLSFDAKSGILVAEAGVLLGDIIKTFLPHGWFPAVTPGTKFVTLGGMIAADVHGKNHHKDGSFGLYVEWIDIVDANGEMKRCSAKENVDLYKWSIGGMGLTGVIVRAAIRLRPVETAWIKQKTCIAENIDEAIETFESSMEATYSVAWIDCLQKGGNLGRSLILLGEHASLSDLDEQQRSNPFNIPHKSALSVPFILPSWALNHWSVRGFNALYYWNGQRQHLQEQLVDWDRYFYPLDAILGWNKIYGRRGFMQFQCVIPLEHANKGLRALLDKIAEAGSASFLAVLKRLGTQESHFSFPKEGYTLALDFPANKKTLSLMEKLDAITIEYGGRFYLAKDSRMTRATFEKSDARVKDFQMLRNETHMSKAFSSAQAKRLGL